MMKRFLSVVTALCLVLGLFAGLAPAARAVDDVILGYLVPYSIRGGDTIYSICKEKGVDFDKYLGDIARINGLTNYNYLIPGNTLWLPMDTAPSDSGYYTLLGHSLIYGETPAGLCQGYGIDYNLSYNMLSALNSNMATFMAGQQFTLPLYSSAAANAEPSSGSSASGPDTTNGGYAAGGSGAGSTGEGYAAGGPGAGTSSGGTAGTNTSAGTSGGTNTVPDVPEGGTVKYYLAQRVLKTGESVSQICADLGVNFAENEAAIRSLNNITNYYNMSVGQVLLIPMDKIPSGSYYRIVAHTVAQGDTTMAVADRYGLNYAVYSGMIQRLNPNTNLNMIYVGQTLLMPQYIANGTSSAAVVPDPGNNTGNGNTGNNTGNGDTGSGNTGNNTGYGYAAGGAGTGSTGAGYAAGGAGPGSGYTEPNGGGTAPTPAPTAAPTATSGTGTTGKIPKDDTLAYYIAIHELKSGEYVSNVCKDLGVDFDNNAERIRVLSNIANYNYLMPGKLILIPMDTAPKSGPYYKIMKHVFVNGDTVYDLCSAYGLDYTNNVAFLQRLNGRDNMASFYVGQSIFMPVYVAG